MESSCFYCEFVLVVSREVMGSANAGLFVSGCIAVRLLLSGGKSRCLYQCGIFCRQERDTLPLVCSLSFANSSLVVFDFLLGVVVDLVVPLASLDSNSLPIKRVILYENNRLWFTSTLPYNVTCPEACVSSRNLL